MSPDKVLTLLDHDRDLTVGLTDVEIAEARPATAVRVVRYPKGAWRPDGPGPDTPGCFGLMIVDGLLVRTVNVGDRACAELLGPGDILQPWVQVGVDGSISIEVDWEAAEGLTLAVLDRDFMMAIAPWPQIVTTLGQRIMTRTHWLAFHLAICHIRRVETRLLLVLWHLADRWGRVTPRGVEIPIALPHRRLAYLVGARRPAVTLALGALVKSGAVTQTSRLRWTLHGDPPATYHQANHDAAHRTMNPCLALDEVPAVETR